MSTFAFTMRSNRTIYNILLSVAIVFMASLPLSAIEEKQFAAVSWKAKGDTCYGAGRLAEALEYYTKALDGSKRNNDDHTYYASIGNIGNIYARMGDFKRALYYFGMGYEAAVKNKETEMQWNFSTNIVAAYCMLKDTKNARAFFRNQMTIPIKDDVKKRYYFLNNQAYISLAENNQQMAEYYFRQTRDFVNERRMPLPYFVSSEMEIGKMMARKGNIDEAMRCFRTVHDTLVNVGNKDMLVGVLKEMSDIYSKSGQKDSAEKYRSQYLLMSDSVFNAQQFNIANSKLFEYENSQTKQRIDSLVSRNNMQLIVIVVFVIMVIGLTLLYIALRRRTRSLLEAQRMLVSKNEELMQNDRQNKTLLEQYVQMANRQAEQANDGAHPSEAKQGVNIDEEQRNKLLNCITSVMNDVEVISKSDFSLQMLADMVESNTKYVSWIINDTYKKNFKTLLNEHRIREACRRLADTEHYGNMTIQAIYEELGYNSAASFIQSFKKVNGITPSMYQKLRQQAVDDSEA